MAALGETKKTENLRSKTEAQHFCSQHGCGNTANRRCSACKLVYYCSLVCQKGHWTIHQPRCAVKDEPTAKELQLFTAIATAVIAVVASGRPSYRSVTRRKLRESKKLCQRHR